MQVFNTPATLRSSASGQPSTSGSTRVAEGQQNLETSVNRSVSSQEEPTNPEQSSLQQSTHNGAGQH